VLWVARNWQWKSVFCYFGTEGLTFCEIKVDRGPSTRNSLIDGKNPKWIGCVVLEQCFAEVLEGGVECIHRRSRLRCYGTLTSPKKNVPSFRRTVSCSEIFSHLTFEFEFNIFHGCFKRPNFFVHTRGLVRGIEENKFFRLRLNQKYVRKGTPLSHLKIYFFCPFCKRALIPIRSSENPLTKTLTSFKHSWHYSTHSWLNVLERDNKKEQVQPCLIGGTLRDLHSKDFAIHSQFLFS